MYYSVYCNRGYAIHGYHSVPPYPASHGCVRNPIPESIFIYNWIDARGRRSTSTARRIRAPMTSAELERRPGRRPLAELREHALVIGEVTLSSGQQASYYVDARRALLRPGGLPAPPAS